MTLVLLGLCLCYLTLLTFTGFHTIASATGESDVRIHSFAVDWNAS